MGLGERCVGCPAEPGAPSLMVMRYRRAVEKLRVLAEACDSVKNWPPEDPFLLEAYVFGDVLEGADPLECVEVALVLNLPPEEVPWESSPHGTSWLEDRLSPPILVRDLAVGWLEFGLISECDAAAGLVPIVHKTFPPAILSAPPFQQETVYPRPIRQNLTGLRVCGDVLGKAVEALTEPG